MRAAAGRIEVCGDSCKAGTPALPVATATSGWVGGHAGGPAIGRWWFTPGRDNATNDPPPSGRQGDGRREWVRGLRAPGQPISTICLRPRRSRVRRELGGEGAVLRWLRWVPIVVLICARRRPSGLRARATAAAGTNWMWLGGGRGGAVATESSPAPGLAAPWSQTGGPGPAQAPPMDRIERPQLRKDESHAAADQGSGCPEPAWGGAAAVAAANFVHR